LAKTLSQPGQAAKTMTYDAMDRLTNVAQGTSNAAYAYDAANNPTLIQVGAASVTQTFDAADQLIGTSSAGGHTSTTSYDPYGRRLVTTNNLGGPFFLYNYDGADNLTRMQTTGASVTYDYDENNLMRVRTVGGLATDAVYDRSADLPQQIENGGDSYIYGPANVPIEEISADGNRHYFSHDQLGSTTAITNQSGAVETTYTYDAYGNATQTSGTFTQPFLFTGQYTDAASKQIYMRSRWYDPVTAQFLTRDPLEAVTAEPFAYTSNNPTNYTDPSGLLLGIPGTPSLGDVVSSVGNAAGAGATWAYQHPGQVAEALAAGGCIVVSDGACIGLVATAFSVSSGANAANVITGQYSLGEGVGHEGIIIGENALLGGAGLMKAGLGAAGLLDGALPSTLAGNAALNAYFTSPAAAGIALEGPIDEAVFPPCE
jgi:RHS repeat-associated protein